MIADSRKAREMTSHVIGRRIVMSDLSEPVACSFALGADRFEPWWFRRSWVVIRLRRCPQRRFQPCRNICGVSPFV